MFFGEATSILPRRAGIYTPGAFSDPGVSIPAISYAAGSGVVPIVFLSVLQPEIPFHLGAVFPIHTGHPLAHGAGELIGDGAQEGSQIVWPLMPAEDLHLVADVHVGQLRQIHHGHVHADT